MDEKKRKKFGSFFYLGVIPIVLTATFSIVLLKFMDVPVWKTVKDWGNNIPVISAIIPGSNSSSAKADTSGNEEYWKLEYEKVEDTLKEKELELADLNKQLDTNQQGLEELLKSKEELQNQLEEDQTQEIQNQMEQTAEIYANIPPAKAAAMLASMPLGDASLTLSRLDADLQSSILGSMKDAKKAAQMTMMIQEIAMLKEKDQNALKLRINELVLQHENPTDPLSETISAMPPGQAASIIQSMMETNATVAMDVMKKVNTNSRSQILSEISKTNAKLAAEIAANLK
jgi:flagellar motility protein MotE (MotC chaperone)